MGRWSREPYIHINKRVLNIKIMLKTMINSLPPTMTATTIIIINTSLYLFLHMNHHHQQQLKIPLWYDFSKPTIKPHPWWWRPFESEFSFGLFKDYIEVFRVDIRPFDDDDPFKFYMGWKFDLEGVCWCWCFGEVVTPK